MRIIHPPRGARSRTKSPSQWQAASSAACCWGSPVAAAFVASTVIALQSEGESTKIKQKGQTKLHVTGEAKTDKGTRDTDG